MIYRIDREPSPAEIRRVLNVFNDSRLEYDEVETEPGAKVGIAAPAHISKFFLNFSEMPYALCFVVFIIRCGIYRYGQVSTASAAAARVPVDLRHYLGQRLRL